MQYCETVINTHYIHDGVPQCGVLQAGAEPEQGRSVAVHVGPELQLPRRKLVLKPMKSNILQCMDKWQVTSNSYILH